MCKKLSFLITFVLVLGLAGNALAEDRNPPDWCGAEGSSWAIWEFNVDPGELTYIEPDGGYYGDTEAHFDPGAIVYGMAPEGVLACVGAAEEGVGFIFNGDGTITVADELWGRLNNWLNEEEGRRKRIRVQITYDPESIEGIPGGESETADGREPWMFLEDMVSTIIVDEAGYLCFEYEYVDRNPAAESFVITPEGLVIDELIVDTICYVGDDPPAGPGRAEPDPYIATNGRPRGDVCADAVTELVWDDPFPLEDLQFDVFFADEPNVVMAPNSCAIPIEPEWDTEYTWSVDTIEVVGGERHAGPEWSFYTGGLASNPTPEDGTSYCIDADTDLYWEGSGCQDSFNLVVSYNEDLSAPIVEEEGITDPFYLDPGLAPSATVYWRVNECNDACVPLAEGAVWSFDTKSTDPPYDDYVGVGHDECITTVSSGISDYQSGVEDPGGQLLSGEGIDKDTWTTEGGGDHDLGVATEWWGESSDAPYPLNGEPNDSTWIMIDLGWVYPELRQMWIWNNNANWTLSGMRYYSVHYSDGGAGDPCDWDWTAITDLELPQSQDGGEDWGYAGYAGSPGPDFGGDHGRYILITSLERWAGGSGNASLNEVKIDLKRATKATQPNPSNGATGVLIDTCLEWTPGAFAADTDGHKVYFGSESEVDITYENEKKITIEITWYSSSLVPQGESWGWEREFEAPWDDGYQIAEEDLGDGWKKTTYVYTVSPNPVGEVITLLYEEVGPGNFIYIDKVVIDTDCNPTIEGGQVHAVWTFDTDAVGVTEEDEPNAPADPCTFDEGIFEEWFNLDWVDGGEWLTDYEGLSGVWKLDANDFAEMGFSLGNYAEEYEEIGDIPYVDTITDPCYCPELDVGTTYYWQIVEVNDVCEWPGRIWSFTTIDYLLIDDFESYGTGTTGTANLRAVWEDHRTLGGQGSVVTLATDPCRSPTHSMWVKYYLGNDGPHYTQRTYASPQDWSEPFKALVLWFYGRTEASYTPPDEIFVTLKDSAAAGGDEATVHYGDASCVYSGAGDACDLVAEEWLKWAIPLAAFKADNGAINLDKIEKIRLGAGQPPAAGIKRGNIYFDDILLYGPTCHPEYSLQYGDFTGDCVVDEDDLWEIIDAWLTTDSEALVEEPCDVNLMVEYLFDTDLTDTAGDFDGVAIGDPTVADGILTLDGDDFVEIGGDFNSINPFRGAIKGGGDFSIAISFMTAEPSILFSSCPYDPDVTQEAGHPNDTDPSYHAMVVFIFPGDEPTVQYDNWYIAAAVSPSDEPMDGQWHYVVTTYDADTDDHVTYLDGVPGEMASFDPNLVNPQDHKILIGGTQQPIFPYEVGCVDMVGDINDVRIYNYVLTPGQIIYLAGIDYISLGPVNLYEEGEGNEVIDFKDYSLLADNWLKKILWP